MFEGSLFATTFLLLFGTMGCKQNNNSNYNDFPNKHPHLQADTINTFSIGDTFQFTTSDNSCCQTFFMHDGKPVAKLVHKRLFKLIDTSSDIAESDCAGCTSYCTYIYKCTALSIDTMVYVVVPQGEIFDTSQASNYSQIESETLQTFAETIEKYSRKYIVSIIP